MVMQEAMAKVFVLFPEVRARVYMDDIKLHLRGHSKEVVERTKHFFGTLMEELRTVKSELSSGEGKSKNI